MQPIDTSILVMDRTDADSYEAADLNRVGAFCQSLVNAAVEELQIIKQMREQYDVAESKFLLADFKAPEINVKTDFAISDTYTLEQMRQYLENIRNIVSQFPPVILKELPQNMRFLTASGANNIEEDLKGSAENLVKRANQTEKYIVDTAVAFQFSGEIYAGGII